MAINKITAAAMNAELGTLLKDFAVKHNLSIGNQRLVYVADGSTMKLSIEFGDKSTTGDINPVYFKECQRNGFRYGLNTALIGKTLKTGKGNCTFMGLRGEYAIVKDTTGGLWKFDPVMVATQLNAA